MLEHTVLKCQKEKEIDPYSKIIVHESLSRSSIKMPQICFQIVYISHSFEPQTRTISQTLQNRNCCFYLSPHLSDNKLQPQYET